MDRHSDWRPAGHSQPHRGGAMSPPDDMIVAHLPPAGAIDAIADARHGDPFAVLGPHQAGQNLWSIRAFLTDAESVDVVLEDADAIPMERVHEAGFFVARIETAS